MPANLDACALLLSLRPLLATPSPESESLLLRLGVELTRLLEVERRHELLLAQVRVGDRLHLQRQVLAEAPVDFREAWIHQHWKAVARQQLAVTAHVRPLVYSDLRARVRAMSATFGRPAGPALRAIHLVADRRLYAQHMEHGLDQDLLAARLYDQLRACGAELA